MGRKKKIIETHGKLENGQLTRLEQIWGFNELARYGTLSEDDYKKSLESMGRADLETHARKLGVVVVESSARLQHKLLQEFKNYKLSLCRPDNPLPQTNSSKEVHKILQEGR